MEPFVQNGREASSFNTFFFDKGDGALRLIQPIERTRDAARFIHLNVLELGILMAFPARILANAGEAAGEAF